MRIRERRLSGAFCAPHGRMAFEDFCLARGIGGRLIPLPREISAGCGLAWSAPPDDPAGLRALLAEAGVAPQHIKEMDI